MTDEIQLDRLSTFGLQLPQLQANAGNYLGWVRAGDLLFVAGQGSEDWLGRVGDTLTVEQGYQAARSCGLNLLAQVSDAVGLSAVQQIVQVRGYVCCTEDLREIPQVLNGASDLLASVFAERGRHARTAIGVQALPMGIAVEVDMVVRLSDS
jgi:enamine deaminase RidA (YjgF/YER057c/UK114 family)